MRKTLGKLFLFGSLLSCLVLFGCGKNSPSASSASPPSTFPPSAPPSPAPLRAGYFKTPWQDESQFIVQTIVTDLAEMAFFSKHKNSPASNDFSVVVQEKMDSSIDSPSYSIEVALDKSISPIKYDLSVNGQIWSPEVYTNLLQKIFDSIGTKSDVVAPGPQDKSLISSLTELTARNLQEQNLALSSALEKQFGDPGLHEKAALLLGAFLLRDSSGGFFEIRSPLCRMTAHLALARQLAGRSSVGLNGRLANAILLTLINNQKSALENLAGMDASEAVLQPWLRSLRTRNTHDYRILAAVKQPSLLEKIELFRAYCGSVDTDIPWGKLSDKEKQTVPDYCRVVNAHSYTVGTGHELLEVSLPLEFAELDQVYSLGHESRLKKDKLTEALNTPPERCFSSAGQNRVRVIGWGQWAWFAQRHLCHTLQHNFNFLQKKWGVPEEAAKFVKGTESMFSGLRLYPFVRWCNCTETADYHRAVDEGMIVTVETPHLVSPQIWNSICYKVPFAELYQPNPNPHVNEWHKHNPPPGTVYDPLPRMHHPSLTRRSDVITVMERLHDLAPYDNNLSFNLIRIKYHGRATYDQMEQIYHPVLEYDSYRMSELAETVPDKPDAYEKLMLKAAAIDPDRYYALGDFFGKLNQDDKAAAYLEKAMALHPDAVAAAGHSSWLINYYQRKGMTSKAMALADQAADVYSYSGLEAKAELLESLGKYAEAWEYFLKIEERYNRSEALMAFVARYKAKTADGRYDQELQNRLKSLFPSGLEKVSFQDFKAPPSDGVIINEENKLVSDAGLKRGDIIVAVNRIRVHTFKQYSYAREVTATPDLALIVWQKDHYAEIKASPPRHRFNAAFASYNGK